jgi:hypothetical protein
LIEIQDLLLERWKRDTFRHAASLAAPNEVTTVDLYISISGMSTAGTLTHNPCDKHIHPLERVERFETAKLQTADQF